MRGDHRQKERAHLLLHDPLSSQRHQLTVDPTTESQTVEVVGGAPPDRDRPTGNLLTVRFPVSEPFRIELYLRFFLTTAGSTLSA